MTTNTPPLWILIDGQNIVHADAYGCGVAHAAQTLAERLELLETRFDPACTISLWDSDVATFRHALFPGYKTGRKRLEGIDQAIAAAKQVCRDHNVAVMDSPGFEADDLIATISDEARRDGGQVLIYSTDRDLHQLLRQGEVKQCKKVRRQGKQLSFEMINAAELIEKYGVRPDQWVDFKVLTGDPSDSIAGVDRIGPVTAANVLKSCGSLDSFYENPFRAPLSDKQRAALMNAKRSVGLVRELCTLRRDVPLPELWREGV